MPENPAARDYDKAPSVWVVNRYSDEDGLYLFENEHQARDFASRYSEVTVSEEYLWNDSAAAQFLIDTAEDDPEQGSEE